MAEMIQAVGNPWATPFANIPSAASPAFYVNKVKPTEDVVAEVVQVIRSTSVELSSRMLGNLFKRNGDVQAALGYTTDATQDAYGKLYTTLVKDGWTLLGSGAYSVALQNEALGDKVLKLEISNEDSHAVNWWDYCADHQGEPMIPVQYAHGSMLDIPFVVMDRLVLNMGRAQWYCDRVSDIRSWINSNKNSPGQLLRMAAERGWDAEELAFAGCLYDIMHSIDHNWMDIHDENIMFCPKTGLAFLTDPIT